MTLSPINKENNALVMDVARFTHSGASFASDNSQERLGASPSSFPPRVLHVSSQLSPPKVPEHRPYHILQCIIVLHAHIQENTRHSLECLNLLYYSPQILKNRVNGSSNGPSSAFPSVTGNVVAIV